MFAEAKNPKVLHMMRFNILLSSRIILIHWKYIERLPLGECSIQFRYGTRGLFPLI